MKKILLALLTLISIISYSQTTGHLRYDTVRVYKQNGNSNLVIENSTRDTLGFLYNYGNGRTRFEKVRAVPGGIKFGEDTIVVSGTQQDFLIGGSVTPEGGFRFSVQEADYGIEGFFYNSDSATVFVDSADATFDRFDVIYLDSDEIVKILEGIPAENPAIPQLPSGTRLLTVVSIEAGAIQANITTINVYFENDATITPSGTTAVGNAITAPYAGTYHIRITTINNGDYIDIIKTSGTWDIAGVDFLSFHIKNLAQVPQLANLRASLWNGSCTGCQVSGEVILNYNKNNITTYNALSIPFAALGNITNTNIDRIRLRFTSNNATNFTGYDLDNIFFGDNMQQPGNGGTGSFRLTLPAFLSPSNLDVLTDGGTYPITANGSSAQYIRGDGSLATFSAVTTVGAFGSQASQTNGLFISGSNIYGQPVTATEPGMATPAMKASWDSSYYVQNLGDGLEIARAVDGATTGLRSLVFIGADTSASNDTTLIIEFTGGTAQRFGFSGEDDTGAEVRLFTFNADVNAFEIRSFDGGDNTLYLNYIDASNVRLGGTGLLGDHYFGATTGGVIMHSDAGIYTVTDIPDSVAAGTHHMVVWNATNDRLYKMDLPTGSGGGGSLNDATLLGNESIASIRIVESLGGGEAASLGRNVDEQGQLTLEDAVLFGTNTKYQIDSIVYRDSVLRFPHKSGTIALLSDITGGGDNFYIDDGTIDDLEREVHLAGNTLEFEGGNFYVDIPSDKLFYVQHGDGNYLIYGSQTSSFIRGQDSTGGGNEGTITADADDEQGRFVLRALFNGATKEAQIVGTSVTGLSAILYEADKHTFGGNILALNDNTNDIGSTTESLKDIYSRRLLLDGSTSGTPTIFSDALGNALNGTTLSGTGVVPTIMFGAIQSDFTMSDVNTVQPVFPTTADVWTLQGATTYFFEGSYTLTHGATSHSTGMSFELAGGASVTSINYQTVSWATAIGTNTASQTTNNINVATNSAINAAGAIAVESIVFSGIIRMNAGGTVTPSITWSAAPGGSPLARIGTWIRFTPIGTNTAASLGNVN